MLDTYGGTRTGRATWRAVLTSGAGCPQKARQGIQGVLRAPREISAVQEVHFVWLVHLSTGLQRVGEARREKETPLSLKDWEHPYCLPQTPSEGFSTEDMHGGEGARRQMVRFDGLR